MDSRCEPRPDCGYCLAIKGQGVVMRKVPDGWIVRLGGQGATFDWQRVRDRFDGTALAYSREGLRAWPGVEAEARVCVLPSSPTLDDLWTVWLHIYTVTGAGISAWEPMAAYCAAARQGFWPDRVPVASSPQALFRTMVQQHLGGASPRPQAFIDAAWALCARLAEALAASRDPSLEDVLGTVPELARYREVLARDREAWLRDLAASRRFVARLAPARGEFERARRLAMVVLDRPQAIQWKTWARTEPSSLGTGYPLTLVRRDDGEIALSIDPALGARVDWIASVLDAAERAGERWYDGRDHGGTLVASPRGGSSLDLTTVVAQLSEELGLEPELLLQTKDQGPALRARLRGPVPALAAAVLLAGGGAALWGLRARGLRAGRARQVVERYTGANPLPRYALLVGVCSYTGTHRLQTPCRNAQRLRDVLVQQYGYGPERVHLLVDGPGTSEGERATARNIRRQVEQMGAQITRDFPLRGESVNTSFLFFYSGHGEKFSYPNAESNRDIYGVLQPADYHEHPELPMAERSLDVGSIREELRRHIPSAQRMVVLDSCYSGVANLGEGAPRPREVRAEWERPTEVVLTSADFNETAMAGRAFDNMGVFTYALTQGLRRVRGTAPADCAPADGVVTDEELAHFVSERVPFLLREQGLREQRPTFRRFAWRGGEAGQFAFVSPARDEAGGGN